MSRVVASNYAEWTGANKNKTDLIHGMFQAHLNSFLGVGNSGTDRNSAVLHWRRRQWYPEWVFEWCMVPGPFFLEFFQAHVHR